MGTPIPENRAAFRLDALGPLIGAVPRALPEGLAVEGVTTDSRGELEGRLFVALVGERFDGHEYLDDARRRGARAAVVRRGAAVPAGLPALEVDDPLVALGAIASLHRRRWGGLVVGVAGSAGKTTTRSVTAAALEAVHPGAVHSVPGNLNNRVGVPMVLLALDPASRVAVVEIGTNQPGEVAELTRVAGPDLGVLTLIELEHSEGLGELDAIEQEEGALLRALPPGGAAIANADCVRSARQLVLAGARRKIGYGTRGAAQYRITRRETRDASASRVTLERPKGRGRELVELDVPLLGAPAALALAAAVAVTDRVAGRAVPAERLAAALRAGRPGEAGRLVPRALADGTLVLDDTYNSNPGSLRASIDTARELADDRGARLVLVLGEMRELGGLAPREHALAGELAAKAGPAAVVAVAGAAAELARAAGSAGVPADFAEDAEGAVALVRARVRAGDVVLVKASRGVRAERIVEALVAAGGGER